LRSHSLRCVLASALLRPAQRPIVLATAGPRARSPFRGGGLLHGAGCACGVRLHWVCLQLWSLGSASIAVLGCAWTASPHQCSSPRQVPQQVRSFVSQRRSGHRASSSHRSWGETKQTLL
jgi:hypothetical protein